MKGKSSGGARTRARELALQALYQMQLSGHDFRELKKQFQEQTAYERVDQEFFNETLGEICESRAELDAIITDLIDRPFEQLDPVELGVLLIGVFELKNRVDIPYRVVINEGVNLAKRFGSLDGHKYINACLDKGAQSLREIEIKGSG
jgi:N utilization substance protein B